VDKGVDFDLMSHMDLEELHGNHHFDMVAVELVSRLVVQNLRFVVVILAGLRRPSVMIQKVAFDGTNSERLKHL
jgi:hypothetical protein